MAIRQKQNANAHTRFLLNLIWNLPPKNTPLSESLDQTLPSSGVTCVTVIQNIRANFGFSVLVSRQALLLFLLRRGLSRWRLSLLNSLVFRFALGRQLPTDVILGGAPRVKTYM